MEWRCEWCGKPHEENDPPCDNCGHGSFEQAVVPMGPEGEGDPVVWVCEACGRIHPRNNPPCSRCGHMTLERREQYPDDPAADDGGVVDAVRSVLGREDTASDGESAGENAGGPADADGGDDDGAPPAAEVAADPDRQAGPTVWVCQACGREHPRHNPPCSRCGAMDLEPREQTPTEVGDGATGYLDVVTVRDVLLAAAVLVVALFALGQAGLVELPGTGNAAPSGDVPGEAERVGDLSLPAVERAYVDEFADRRQQQGLLPVGPDERLSAAATDYNRRLVAAEYGDADRPELRAVLGDHDLGCSRPAQPGVYTVPVDGGTDALAAMAPEELAARLLDEYLADEQFRQAASTVGVDVHVAPDGTVYVTHLVC